ncbi:MULTISPECIES: PAS domain S-box protein [unclassified Leptolyngbya]|uniref:PAS domain S-box protein n=1 Tax=unclassified Leptolyngbya TaxID=2650499 RepID=UPI001684D5A7|nr:MULTISPECIES: PAS domain S-box protein [unclassified Leptolyngbya]MBD1910957.1 PAS domain S-box protein [Leptolyngbya sp. FACHB-8]MBD2158377.1 PAS domain S-box protein [Leptolyngbya sp. FACHB-16]
MGFEEDCLQALRGCCRDDAAFEQLCGLLSTMDQDTFQRATYYKAMLDASPDLMFRISAEGQYLDFKANGVRSIPQDVVLGKYLTDLLPPDVAELCQSVIQKALTSGKLQTCEYQLTEPTGQRYYEARVAVSGPQEVLWVVQDVTDRQQVAEELRASEERLQSFFDATFEAVVIHNYQRILDVNPAAEDLFGYTYDEMIGMSVLDLADMESKGSIAQRWRSLNSPTQPYDYESIGIRKDGTQFIAEVSVKAIYYRGTLARVASIRDVTVQRRSEQVVRESESRNRALLQAVPDLIFRIRRDGTYLDCKAGENSTLMVPAENLIGKSVYDVLPPKVAEERMQYVHRALETGKIQNFEYQLKLAMIQPYAGLDQLYRQMVSQPDGSPIDPNHLRDYEARVVVSGEDEVIAIVRDISDRKRSEDALRQSEEKFSKTFKSSPNPMTIATLGDGRLMDVNDGFLETFGYNREDLLGHSVYEINFWVNPAQRDEMVQILQTKGEVRNLEYQFHTRTGEIRDVLFSAEIIQISGQACLIDVMTDITERKRTEQKLLEAAERDRLLGQIALRIRESLDLQQILNTTVTEVRQYLKADRVCIGHGGDNEDTGVIIAEAVVPQWSSLMGSLLTDPEHLRELKELFSNGQVRVLTDTQQMTGYPAIAAHYARFQVRAALSVPIMLENSFFGLLVVHQCSGPRHWQPSEVELMQKLAVQVSIAVQQAKLYEKVRDLNRDLERKVQERTAELQQKMEELQELNELKDEFLNAFSHDLRTPVMGISLVINNLLNQPGDTIPVSRMILERMVQSNQHQLQLIKSFLEAHSAETRGVHLNPELVQLGLLVQVIVEDLEPLVQKNKATLVNEVPPDLPLVNADPVQLRRVFENLVTNALNHNPPGIHIRIGATVEEDWIRFTIEDNGVGMSQETRDRLFQRYSRGPKSRHSTGIGLGLYLCRQIVTAHGGQIGVISEPNQGATFWLTIPLAIPTGANLLPEE